MTGRKILATVLSELIKVPGVKSVHSYSKGHQDFKHIIVAPSGRKMHTVVAKLINIFQLQAIFEQNIHHWNMALKTGPLQGCGFEVTIDGTLHHMADPIGIQIRLCSSLLEEEADNVCVTFARRPD